MISIFGMTLLPAENAKQEGLLAWLSRILKQASQRKGGAVRGEVTQTADRLVIADLATQTERNLFECGSCWSPALLDDNTVAFLKTDGVWLIPVSEAEAPRLAIPAEALQEIAGVLRSGSALLLIRSRRGQPDCAFTMVKGDLESGAVSDVSDAPVSCLHSTDLSVFTRPGTVRKGRILLSSRPGAKARTVLVRREGAKVSEPLLPFIDEKEDGLHRFSPVWLSDTRVLYGVSK